MPPRKYETRCQVCGSDHLVLVQKQTTTMLISREYKLKKSGIPSGKGILMDKFEETQSFWLIRCNECNWSQLISGPDE